MMVKFKPVSMSTKMREIQSKGRAIRAMNKKAKSTKRTPIESKEVGDLIVHRFELNNEWEAEVFYKKNNNENMFNVRFWFNSKVIGQTSFNERIFTVGGKETVEKVMAEFEKHITPESDFSKKPIKKYADDFVKHLMNSGILLYYRV